MLVTPGTNRCEATLDEHGDSQSTPLENNKTRSRQSVQTAWRGRDTKHTIGDPATGANQGRGVWPRTGSQRYTAKEDKQDKTQTHLIIFYPNLCDFSFQRLCDSYYISFFIVMRSVSNLIYLIIFILIIFTLKLHFNYPFFLCLEIKRSFQIQNHISSFGAFCIFYSGSWIWASFNKSNYISIMRSEANAPLIVMQRD